MRGGTRGAPASRRLFFASRGKPSLVVPGTFAQAEEKIAVVGRIHAQSNQTRPSQAEPSLEITHEHELSLMFVRLKAAAFLG